MSVVWKRNRFCATALCCGIALIHLVVAAAAAQTLSDLEVDACNVRAGTQTFSPRYKFSGETKLVETAEAIQGMGSDIIKFYMGKNINGQYGIPRPASITTLLSLAESEPSFRRVFDMPFRHYFIWIYCLTSANDTWWKDGFSNSERTAEYNEVYAFSRYLLTNYNNTGKSFYFGHWEGDWHLLNNYDTSVNPSPTAIQGMVDWLNTRQKAVDDALQSTPHTNVFIYNYTEANRVRDAMVNGANNNQRVVNAVLPLVTNIDYISWSAYDGMDLNASELHATLNYIDSQLPTNKASRISGKRVILGEYGWGGTLSSEAQEPPTRAFLQRTISWGAPFVLFWQMYDNENRAYWLIDSNNTKTPSYFLHERFINRARLLTARFKESNGRLPTGVEFEAMTTPLLNQPLAAPTNITIKHLPISVLTSTSAVVNARVEQGVYGDAQANIRVFWGKQDGGTNAAAWEYSLSLGANTNFNPATFSAPLDALEPETNYFFRFLATNAAATAWASGSGRFTTDLLEPAQFGSRMKISFAGYNGDEPLIDFPLLVSFNTNHAGFSYRQFASRTGGDLRFTDATGTQPIVHEVDEWNTNGTSHTWVRVPLITGTEDFIWAYWGNPVATNPPAYTTNGAVWSNGFELVWHLKENTFPYFDSTLKHHGTSGTAPAGTAAGMIGRGVAFNGTSQFLNAGAVNLGDQFTLSAWVRVDTAANSIQTIWANKSGGSATPGFALFVNSWQTRDAKLILETGNGSLAAYAATDTNIVTHGQWKHVAAAVDRAGGKARLFVDGVDRGVTDEVRTDFANDSNLALGRFINALYYFRGTMDEARIESGLRSSNWIRAAWMNVASNSTFLAYADVTESSAALSVSRTGDALAFHWPAPAVGYVLQSTTNLAPPVTWMPVTNQTTLAEDKWQAAVFLTNQQGYFRLQRP